MSNPFFEKLKKIRGFVFDVDGVMTDGQILLLEDGEWLRQVNIRDGFALKTAVDLRYKACVISGSGSEAIMRRMNALGVENVYMRVENKMSAYEKFLMEEGLHAEETLFMGDDIPDLEAMRFAGFSACPQDAVPEVKSVADYITEARGGHGAVREVIEMALKVHHKWNF